MKKSTVLSLRRFEKINNDKAIGELTRLVSDINASNDFLKSQKINIQNESILYKERTNQSPYIEYISNWERVARTEIDIEQAKIPSCERNLELARLNLRKSNKKLEFYNELPYATARPPEN